MYVTDNPSTSGGTYITAKEIDVTSDPNGDNSNWSTTQDVFIDGNVGIGDTKFCINYLLTVKSNQVSPSWMSK